MNLRWLCASTHTQTFRFQKVRTRTAYTLNSHFDIFAAIPMMHGYHWLTYQIQYWNFSIMVDILNSCEIHAEKFNWTMPQEISQCLIVFHEWLKTNSCLGHPFGVKYLMYY